MSATDLAPKSPIASRSVEIVPLSSSGFEEAVQTSTIMSSSTLPTPSSSSAGQMTPHSSSIGGGSPSPSILPPLAPTPSSMASYASGVADGATATPSLPAPNSILLQSVSPVFSMSGVGMTTPSVQPEFSSTYPSVVSLPILHSLSFTLALTSSANAPMSNGIIVSESTVATPSAAMMASESQTFPPSSTMAGITTESNVAEESSAPPTTTGPQSATSISSTTGLRTTDSPESPSTTENLQQSSSVSLATSSNPSTTASQETPTVTTSGPAQATPPSVHAETSATTIPTTVRTTSFVTTRKMSTTLDTSFATSPYWLKMDIGIPTDTNDKDPTFRLELETNLARMYAEAERRNTQREAEVEQLLQDLNPENNPALGPALRRRRRAATVDSSTAQIIDVTRNTQDPGMATLIFYMVQDGTKVPAGESSVVLQELNMQEMTLYLGVAVYTLPAEYEPQTTEMPTAPPDRRLWIIGAVLGPLAFLMLLCLCCCCCCCNRRPTKEEGPMDPDTFKMLQFKAKYPYRPYPPSQQDQHLQPVPRGFDVVKQDYANSAFGMEGGTTERQRRNEETEVMIQRELPPRSVEGHKSPILHPSKNHYTASHSPTPSGSSNSSLVPPLPPKTKVPPQRALDSSMSGSEAGEELYKQRREYMAAQEEISRVLEPELFSSMGRKSQKSKSSAKKGAVQKLKDKKIESERIGGPGGGGKGKLKKMESLPDNHYARGGVNSQEEEDIQMEPLQETKQKMHALIDEAFSLVGKTSPSKNAVAPTRAKLAQMQELNSSRSEGWISSREQNHVEQASDYVVPTSAKRKQKDVLRDGMTQTSDLSNTSRVVVVPVSKPPQEGSRLVWSPYQAGDEVARLSPSQEPASIPGGVNPSPESPRSLPGHQFGSATAQERRPDGDSLRGRQGAVERYADMLKDMLDTQNTEQQPSPEVSTRAPLRKRSVALLEGEPDYEWSFDRSVTGSRGRGSKPAARKPEASVANVAKPPRTERSLSSEATPPSEGKVRAMLSSREHGVGKAVDKFYDELDVSSNLRYPTGQYSPQVTNAVREELIRLTRRMGDGEESVLV
ncbi:uncharacterized protein [Diadema antillarum]|uniref:uncharacterized protein n=1 Tax=Diadema antillarum TaxID=105358 RepID=UPI003A86C54F